MRGALLVLAVVPLMLLASACGSEMDTYEGALDSDREAREKMMTALGLMRDAGALADSEFELAERKRGEAVDAYVDALASWAEAEEVYRDLIELYPGDPTYLNNLANLLYCKALSGLDPGFEGLVEAERLIDEALARHDREIFSRNLELIGALRGDEETARMVEDNVALVEELAQLVSAAEHS